MTYINQPLSVIFIHHQLDKEQVEPIIEYVQEQLNTDVNKPFSRNCNIPVFSFMGNMEHVPIVPKNCNIKSEHTLIFPFISQYWTGDKKWHQYVKDLLCWKEAELIPIALDTTAFRISEELGKSNFIRIEDFTKDTNENMYLSIAHEIYRHAFIERASNPDSVRLKLFLSHAKQGNDGVKIAKILKSKIDNSILSNFFDMYDIMPTSEFENKIKKEIQKSSMILVQTDFYSSSQWCQREIQWAKEYNRPIIEVNALDHYVDRKYPYATNYPVVHVETSNLTERMVLEILVAVLTETLRYCYNQKKLDGNSEYTLPKPPELVDVLRLTTKKGQMSKNPTISENIDIPAQQFAILYPDPPIYPNELEFFKWLNCNIYTPLTKDEINLNKKNIGISISAPASKDLISIGQNSNHLKFLSQEIAKYILGKHGSLIYGGDLRKDGFTQYLLEECQILSESHSSVSLKVVNYRSWPLYNNTKSMIEWDAKYAPFIENIITKPGYSVPQNVKDLFVPPDTSEHLFWWATSLTHMRKEMICNCDARICAGGKFFGYKGKMPGVLEEILIALDQNKPLYLLGGFGGVVQEVTHIICANGDHTHLTMKWQTNNNLMYAKLMEKYQEFSNEKTVNYEEIYNNLSTLKFEDLHNGLSEEENKRLFTTVYYDEAIHLILKGLKEIYPD